MNFKRIIFITEHIENIDAHENHLVAELNNFESVPELIKSITGWDWNIKVAFNVN